MSAASALSIPTPAVSAVPTLPALPVPSDVAAPELRVVELDSSCVQFCRRNHHFADDYAIVSSYKANEGKLPSLSVFAVLVMVHGIDARPGADNSLENLLYSAANFEAAFNRSCSLAGYGIHEVGEWVHEWASVGATGDQAAACECASIEPGHLDVDVEWRSEVYRARTLLDMGVSADEVSELLGVGRYA